MIWVFSSRQNPAAQFPSGSRIRKVMRTDMMFEPNPEFDVAVVIRDSFGIVRGEKVMRVRLLFSSRVAAYIRERVWHPT